MARIGLLGGMGWESSAEDYRLLNVLTAERLGGLHSADCVLLSVDFAPVEELQVAGRWEEAGVLLASAARSLEAAGCDVVLLCTNTMHQVFDAVAGAVSVPMLHIADVTAQAVKRTSARKVGLLGTAYTMDGGFYVDRLVSHGLTVMVPEAEGRELVHRVIYDELCRGIVTEESRGAFLRLIDVMAEHGAEGVILGCTEIELLVSQEHTDVPLYPTTRLHVEAALDFSPLVEEGRRARAETR